MNINRELVQQLSRTTNKIFTVIKQFIKVLVVKNSVKTLSCAERSQADFYVIASFHCIGISTYLLTSNTKADGGLTKHEKGTPSPRPQESFNYCEALITHSLLWPRRSAP